MNKLLLTLSALAIALPTAAHSSPANTNQALIAQTRNTRDQKTTTKRRKDIDISIKEVDPRNGVKYNQIIPANPDSQNKFVYYDKDYRGQGCVLSCDKFDGLIVKWSSFYLQIQPYEKECLFICHTSFPMPSKEVKIYADKQGYKVGMIDEFEYIYYVPLEVRQAIKTASTFSIQVAGVGLSTYSPSDTSLADIKKVIDTNEELEDQLHKTKTSTKERLIEAKELFENGLITKEEYEEIRKQVLGLQSP